MLSLLRLSVFVSSFQTILGSRIYMSSSSSSFCIRIVFSDHSRIQSRHLIFFFVFLYSYRLFRPFSDTEYTCHLPLRLSVFVSSFQTILGYRIYMSSFLRLSVFVSSFRHVFCLCYVIMLLVCIFFFCGVFSCVLYLCPCVVCLCSVPVLPNESVCLNLN